MASRALKILVYSLQSIAAASEVQICTLQLKKMDLVLNSRPIDLLVSPRSTGSSRNTISSALVLFPSVFHFLSFFCLTLINNVSTFIFDISSSYCNIFHISSFYLLRNNSEYASPLKAATEETVEEEEGGVR
jgi:hypothetical protein